MCSRVRVVVVPTAMMRRPSLLARVDGGGGGGGEGVGLGVEADVFGAVDADGLEGAEADVERDVSISTPRCLSASRISGVKWRPAVGAAAEPRSLA